MEKELEISAPLDQSLVVDDSDILLEIEVRINRAISLHDADEAFLVCEAMIGQMKRSGIALAKALWMIKTDWDKLSIGDDFFPTAQHYLGLHPHTIERYVKVWDMLDKYVPESIRAKIQQKNIKILIPIANAIAQGFEIEDSTWKKLVAAPDYSEVSKIVREEIKDESPRKNNLTLQVDGLGSVWAYNSGEKYYVGSLEVGDERDIVIKAIERIISNSGILKGY